LDLGSTLRARSHGGPAKWVATQLSQIGSPRSLPTVFTITSAPCNRRGKRSLKQTAKRNTAVATRDNSDTGHFACVPGGSRTDAMEDHAKVRHTKAGQTSSMVCKRNANYDKPEKGGARPGRRGRACRVSAGLAIRQASDSKPCQHWQSPKKATQGPVDEGEHVECRLGWP